LLAGKMSNQKSHIINHTLAALILCCFCLYSCENDEAAVKEAFAKKIGVDEAKNVIIKYSVGGKPKAKLTAPIMYNVQDTVPYIEFPKTLHVDFFDDSDKLESKLDAHYAKYKEQQSKVFLKDSVRVINIKGDTLYCDELYWDRNRTGTEFYTDKPVKIRTKTHIINGIGMDAKQDFSEWHIVQSTGFIKVPASQFPQ
jgi:LPS export ABC transporter protein LptC